MRYLTLAVAALSAVLAAPAAAQEWPARSVKLMVPYPAGGNVDTAARIGGDDFGIIVPDADLAVGRLIARRIAHEIERLNATDWADQLPVTVTFGVATGIGCEPTELFAAADQQLSDYKTRRPALAFFRQREDSTGPFVA